MSKVFMKMPNHQYNRPRTQSSMSFFYLLATLLTYISSNSSYGESSSISNMADTTHHGLIESAQAILSNYGAIITVVLSAIFIIIFARKKTYRGYSFKIRASLNNIEGYSKLLRTERLGKLSEEQIKHIDAIISATTQIIGVIRCIEENKIHSANKETSFDLRSALMEINAYCKLLSNSKPELAQDQKDCINEIIEGSNMIIKAIK